MSEEVKVKISQPMFEVGELEIFDNNIHSIVEEYSKLLFKEKDQILTQRIIMKQEEEIERLNENNQAMQEEMARTWEKLDKKENIIKEVREYIEHENFKRNILVGVSTKKYTRDILNNILEILDKENINEENK